MGLAALYPSYALRAAWRRVGEGDGPTKRQYWAAICCEHGHRCEHFPVRHALSRVRWGLDSGTNQNRMPEEIAKANIEHYKKLLETETDAQKRAVIERLMAEEELKISAALKARAERRKG